MKPGKTLWKISIATTREAEEAVADMLGGFFKRAPSSFFDFETKICRVAVFVPGKVPPPARGQLRQNLKRIEKCGLEIGAGGISIAKVRPRDWAESWKRHFKPIEIGTALLLKPAWSKRRPRAGQAMVLLNPGLSFGTGQHPTTRYCLAEMVRAAGRRLKNRRWDGDRPENRQSVLDLGTGSGILAIAAAKLGFGPVRAIDFDAEAIRTARANARANRVRIDIVQGDAASLPMAPKKRFDFVCANLISDLLLAERKRIVAQLKPGGLLVLAGILNSEFTQVRRAFERAGLKLASTRTENEWQSGSFLFPEKF